MDPKISALVISGFGLLELLLCGVSRRLWIRLLLPAVLFVLSAVLFLYGRFAPLESLKDLAYMVTGVFLFFGFLSSAAVAAVFSLVKRKRR